MRSRDRSGFGNTSIIGVDLTVEGKDSTKKNNKLSSEQFRMLPKAKPQQPKDTDYHPTKDKPRNVEQCYKLE